MKNPKLRKISQKGKDYYYVGRGKGAIAIRSAPGTPQFDAEVRAAQKALMTPPETKLAANVGGLILWFFLREEFQRLEGPTKRDYRYYLEGLEQTMKDIPLAAFTNEKLIAGLVELVEEWHKDNIAKSPFVAYQRKAVLRRLVNVAAQKGRFGVAAYKVHNPFKLLSTPERPTRAAMVWSEDDEEKANLYFPENMLLALQMGLCFGQRPGDLLRAVYADSAPDQKTPWYDGERLFCKQSKRGAFVGVKAIEPVKTLLDRAFKRQGYGRILRNDKGDPWDNRDSFSNSFRRSCVKAGIREMNEDGTTKPGLTFYDSRGSLATRLSNDADADYHDIATVTGHSSRSAEKVLKANYLGPQVKRADRVMEKLEKSREKPAPQSGGNVVAFPKRSSR